MQIRNHKSMPLIVASLEKKTPGDLVTIKGDHLGNRLKRPQPAVILRRASRAEYIACLASFGTPTIARRPYYYEVSTD